MGQQGSYPIGTRILAGTDTLTGVVTSSTADIPVSSLVTYLAANKTALGAAAAGNNADIIQLNSLLTVPSVVSNAIGTASVTAALALSAPTGSSLVGFQQSGTGAVARTLQDKARESVSVLDFGAKGDGVTVDTDAFIRAISTSLNIYIPAGTYLIGPTVLSGTGQMLYLGINTGNASRSGMTILGAGQGNTTLKLQNGAGSNALMFGLGLSDVLSDATFSDFAIDLNGANNDTNTIYNNAFYFYGKCTNILWERITVKNMATHQPIRVGNETLAGFGNGITIRNCTFDTFGLAGGYTTTDISVLYIQADNVKVLDNTFTNPSFTLNTGKGHTAIEVNGATSTIIRGNRFRYVQLCTLIDSFYQDHTNIEIQGNTYSQCNFLVACDTVGSTFAQSRISVKGNTWGSTWNNASSVIQLGATGESAKTREYITIEGNIIYGWGNFNQGNNIIYANSNYLRSLLIQNNDIGGYAGSLIYLLGTVQNSNYLDITIQNNRLDSLGQSSGGTCFIDIEPSSGTINALNITGNTFFNTSLNNYSTKGAIKLSGNINYINIQGNTGMNGVGSTYPMVVDSMVNGTWLSKVVDSSTVSGNSELPVDYRPNIVALAGNTSVNIYDFSTFTLNNFTMLEIDVWGSVGGSSNGSLVSYKVLVASSAKIATLITQGGTYGTNVTLNFSGNILRITSTTATALSCMFRIKGLTTTPIAWLI